MTVTTFAAGNAFATGRSLARAGGVAAACLALLLTPLVGSAADPARKAHAKSARKSPAKSDPSTHVVPLGTCCAPPAATKVLAKSLFDAGMTVLADGAGYPRGHAQDVYFTGLKPAATRPTPADLTGYRFTALPSTALNISLQKRFPALVTVRFRSWFESDGRTLLPSKKAEIVRFLQRSLGEKTTIEKLGQGGQQIAFSACPTAGPCVVVKVRKIATLADPKRQSQAVSAAVSALRQDLAMFTVADIATQRGTWRNKRLARVAKLVHPELLAEGIVAEEFVRFRPTAEVDKLFEQLRGPSGLLRDKAWSEAPKFKVNRVRLLGFFDAFSTLQSVGPDVIRLSSFVRGCQEVAAVPTAKSFCDTIKRTYRVPDDFLQRVEALEQLYRDTAGAVIRWKRANFKRATGNPGADGKTREIGLDYNHGRNVGWDPDSEQFVLFDA